jgi:predicted Rossmann fold nucleotide-binding protein DprA/Smf involved in DNA uptake
VFYRTARNNAEVRHYAQLFEAGEITGPDFHKAIRALPTLRETTYVASIRYEQLQDREEPLPDRPIDRRENLAQRLLDTLKAGPGTPYQLAKRTGAHRGYAQNALARMHQQGRVQRTGPGNRAGPFVYRLP